MELRGGAVGVEVNLYEVSYQIDVVKGQFVETVKDVPMMQSSSSSRFSMMFICTPSTWINVFFLKTRVVLREDGYQKERELAIK